VPAGDLANWHYPGASDSVDGKVYGRGALDMKAACAVLVRSEGHP